MKFRSEDRLRTMLNDLIPAAGIVRAGLLLCCILLAWNPALRAQQNECWNLFRNSRDLAGASGNEIPDQMEILWTYKTGDEIKSSPVVCQDRIVIASTDGKVYCLDLEGRLQWSYTTENSIEASALILNGVAYIGDLDGIFHAIDLFSGDMKWKYHTGNQIMGSANWIVRGSATHLFFGSYDFYLHCVEAESGEGLWKYESDNFINGAAALWNDHAVFGGCDGYLHMVDLSAGETGERIDLQTYIAGSAAISGHLAFLGDYDGVFRCVDLASGKILWKWEEENMYLPFIASPAVSADRVVTGNENKFIYCFDQQTGTLHWKVNTRARVHASPVISGNRVLVSNLRGDLLQLDLQDGSILNEYELGSPVYSNPVIYQQRIILGAGDGMVYCMGKKQKQ